MTFSLVPLILSHHPNSSTETEFQRFCTYIFCLIISAGNVADTTVIESPALKAGRAWIPYNL